MHLCPLRCEIEHSCNQEMPLPTRFTNNAQRTTGVAEVAPYSCKTLDPRSGVRAAPAGFHSQHSYQLSRNAVWHSQPLSSVSVRVTQRAKETDPHMDCAGRLSPHSPKSAGRCARTHYLLMCGRAHLRGEPDAVLPPCKRPPCGLHRRCGTILLLAHIERFAKLPGNPMRHAIPDRH